MADRYSMAEEGEAFRTLQKGRFEALTEEDFDHAISMFKAALARRGAEAKGWKRLAFDLIKAAGGTQRISALTAMSAHTEDTLQAHQDMGSGDRQGTSRTGYRARVSALRIVEQSGR